jgi:hypothetical protein
MRAAEEHDEHRCLGEPADPRLATADPPGAIASRDGARAVDGSTRTAVRLGKGDAREITGSQSRDPVPPGHLAAVTRDEAAVAEARGVAQVQVAVAAHELGEQLEGRWLAGGVHPRRESTANGEQPTAPLRPGR